jgi:hypothetical protein
MDRQSVMHHLRAWADGVDPETGAALPADHPGQRPATLRVIFATIALLEQVEPQGASGAPAPTSARGPANAGRPWSSADDHALTEAFDAGSSISAIATGLGRTRNSITARLVKLGRIEPPAGLRLRGEGSPAPGRDSTASN